MLRSNYLIIFIIIVAHFGGSQSAPTSCSLPESDEKGQCVKSCPSLNFSEIVFPDVFDDYQNRKSACDSIIRDTLCCEIAATTTTTTTKIITTFTTRKPLVFTTKVITRAQQVSSTAAPLGLASRDKWASIKNHKNLKLFNFDKCGVSNPDRVAFGENAGLFEYPWTVRLAYTPNVDQSIIKFQCGGSLISEFYVLTAAHCINVSGHKLKSVRLGEYDDTTDKDCNDNGACADPYQDIEIESAVSHPNFEYRNNNKSGNGAAIYSDIGLIRLSKAANLKHNNIKTICLPLQQKTKKLGKKYIVAGWGRTELDKASHILRKATVPPVDLNDCITKYGVKSISIDNTMMCAGGDKSKADACKGDSGGPLMAPGMINDKPRTVQFGIVSAGIAGCGTVEIPGIYTNVEEFTNWILDNMH